MKHALRPLATPDGPTRVAVAVAYLHLVDPPVTTGKIGALLCTLGRRDVERHLLTLEADELVEIHPGRPRTIVPLVRMVPWDDPLYRRSLVISWPIGVRASNRAKGCPHVTTARWGMLCLECAEIVDEAAVPSSR